LLIEKVDVVFDSFAVFPSIIASKLVPPVTIAIYASRNLHKPERN